MLAARARRVFAVDPAALQPEVLALDNVTHLRQKAAAAVSNGACPPLPPMTTAPRRPHRSLLRARGGPRLP